MGEDIKPLLRLHNLKITDDQLVSFQKYYELLIEWNQQMNLTAITEPNEVTIKHFFDSLTPSLYFNFTNQKMIDIGAGAGFPSIPLKICFPDLQLTLLDSLNKRLVFLEEVINKLNLNAVSLVHGRAEDIGNKLEYRQGFDLAISRAVAKLNIISELSLPFLKVGGKMISLKGSNVDDELKEAQKAIKVLGGQFEQKYFLELPENFGQRNIVIINKITDTPNKYPRKPGVPNKNPII